MAYEKQFWEQPYHNSSEEERLEKEVTKHKLQLSIAVELLTSRVDTALAMFEHDKDWQSDNDWEDILKAMKFINQAKGKDIYVDARHKIESYLESKNYYQ
ncbi:MAG TPA: hypothetical protein VD884_13330 [Ohtaekwangia sp.]|nr:hypothetical protein [Ohtaekwangia sp.]